MDGEEIVGWCVWGVSRGETRGKHEMNRKGGAKKQEEDEWGGTSARVRNAAHESGCHAVLQHDSCWVYIGGDRKEEKGG